MSRLGGLGDQVPIEAGRGALRVDPTHEAAHEQNRSAFPGCPQDQVQGTLVTMLVGVLS